MFYYLNYLEKGVISSTKQFIVHKCFQSDISVGQLTNTNNVRNMVTDDQLYALFKNNSGALQFYIA